MVPTRTCVGCRTARPTDALVRVVRQADGQLRVDRKGPGRGAWVCRGSDACLSEAARRRAFQRAFRAPVEMNAIERLQADITNASKQAVADVRG